MHPKLVMVTGIDGSGKSTLTKLLVKQLKMRNYRVSYVWIKSLHSFVFLVNSFLKTVTLEKPVLNPHGVIISRFEPTDYRALNRLWVFLEFISVLPWISLRVYLPIIFGFIVVADRYVIDTIVTISIRIKELNFANSFFGRLLLKMIPKETIIIHLDVDLCTVLRRRHDIEYTLEEIENQIMLYRKLAKRLNAYNMNTAKLSIEESLDLVCDKLDL